LDRSNLTPSIALRAPSRSCTGCAPAARARFAHRPACRRRSRARAASRGRARAASPEIDAALEAERRIGAEAQLARFAGDRLGGEIRAFEEDVGRRRRDRGRLSAHDAGERDRLRLIGDDEIAGFQRERRAVQELDRFAGARVAHADAAFELLRIERVQRLPQLEHDVVGDVHDRADRAQPAPLEARLHPARRRGAGVDAAHEPAAVARARFRRFQNDRQRVRKRRLDASRARRFDARAGYRGNLARDAEDREAVTAIRRGLGREDAVFEVEHDAHVGAHFRVGRERHHAGGLGGEAQLLLGAEHAVRFDAAHRRRADLHAGDARADERRGHLHADAHVRRAADDRERRDADVHPAHREAIGRGMLLHRHDLADDDTLEGRGRGLDLLDLETGERERVREPVGGERRIREGAQPVFGELHLSNRQERQENPIQIR
jgi:hypothetical protein